MCSLVPLPVQHNKSLVVPASSSAESVVLVILATSMLRTTLAQSKGPYPHAAFNTDEDIYHPARGSLCVPEPSPSADEKGSINTPVPNWRHVPGLLVCKVQEAAPKPRGKEQA